MTKIYHVLNQDNGSFLAEVRVTNGVCEICDTDDSVMLQSVPKHASVDELYRLIDDLAACALDMSCGDFYITDEYELELLHAS